MADRKKLSAGSAVEIKSFRPYSDVVRRDEARESVQDYVPPYLDAQILEVDEDSVASQRCGGAGMIHDKSNLRTIAISLAAGIILGLLIGGTVAASGLLATIAFSIGSLATVFFLAWVRLAGIRAAVFVRRVRSWFIGK